MDNGKKFTRTLVFTALLIAVMLVLNFTGLGLIPIPFLPLKVTTLHIPVIIGACLLGPKVGGVLGGAFGLLSFITHSFIAPTVTSFVFTPLYSLGDYHGNFFSLVICFVPRILIGVFAGLIYKRMTLKGKIPYLSGALSGVIGPLTNTILVLAVLLYSSGRSTPRSNPKH